MLCLDRILEEIYDLYQNESCEMLEDDCDRQLVEEIAGKDDTVRTHAWQLFEDGQYKGFVAGIGLGIELATMTRSEQHANNRVTRRGN